MIRTNEKLLVKVVGLCILLIFAGFHHSGSVQAQSCVQPPADMVGWWTGDGNSDDLAGGNNGILQNGTAFSTGKVEQAFSFDGVDDYVQIADSTSLRASGEITIDFWANFNEVPRSGVFADNFNLINKVGDYYVMWRADLNLLQFSLTDACDGLQHLAASVSLPSLQPSEWHHYALVAIDGGTAGPEFHIYFDGIEQPYVLAIPPGHAGCGFFTGPTGDLHIGRLASPTAPPMYFEGFIDEVEIFNRALSDSEIQSIYNAGSAGKCKEVVATCGGVDVFKTGDRQFHAPSFSGNLIIGTNDSNWLIGTSGPDLILGLDGPDDIFGKGGDDVICGGKGVDIIKGQGGNDIIYGEGQSDWLMGGSGNDIIYGGQGWDDLEGNNGQDTLYGEGGYDVILGGASGDAIFGGAGPDALFGQLGNDDLNGGSGNDFCKGGLGSDTITRCEGASSAAINNGVNDISSQEARRLNDNNGENIIVQRVQETFLPLITK